MSGASVGIPSFSVEIKNNCNAIYEIGLYASAVFAYPATLTERTLGFAMGSILTLFKGGTREASHRTNHLNFSIEIPLQRAGRSLETVNVYSWAGASA